MDNQAHNKIKDLISQHNQIGIVLSKNPHVDHAAAGLGLYLALKQMGKNLVVASPTPPTVEISNLVGIDKVKNTLGTDGADLTVAFPYKDGEIEKVSYTLENGFLNIVVKAGDKGLSFQDKDIQFKRAETKVPPLMFFVGVARLTDLGNMFNPDAFKDTTIVNIDNRAENQGFGDVLMVSPKFSSVSEQVAHFISELNSVDIDQDMAQNLLSGISHATNDFQDAKTSYLAFEMAGVLMRKGATRQRTMQKEEKQESNASFFPYQPQRQQPQQQRQQFPRPSFPKPFQHQNQPQQNQHSQQQPQQRPAQENNNAQSQRQQSAPSDWLTPKVYKGSTVL